MGQVQLYITVKIINPSELPNVLMVQFKDELGDLIVIDVISDTKAFFFFLFVSRSILDGCFFKNGPQTNKPGKKTKVGKGQVEEGKENRKIRERSISSL